MNLPNHAEAVDDLLCEKLIVPQKQMNSSPAPLEVVALLEDMPGAGLVAGQVGTVVEKLDDDVYEIEFCDDRGRTYAELALHARQLIALRYSSAVA